MMQAVRVLAAAVVVAAALIGCGGSKPRGVMMGVGEGFGYSQFYANPQSNEYFGATSRGPGWTIQWAGPKQSGVEPIGALLALRDHLTHLQTTNVASESNAKMLIHVIRAIEEHDGAKPSIGGELNKLIPE